MKNEKRKQNNIHDNAKKWYINCFKIDICIAKCFENQLQEKVMKEEIEEQARMKAIAFFMITLIDINQNAITLFLYEIICLSSSIYYNKLIYI